MNKHELEISRRAALIVIDVQKGMVGLDLSAPLDRLVARARMMIDAFRQADLPVIFVRRDHSAAEGQRAPRRVDQSLHVHEWQPSMADLLEGLDVKESDTVITKYQWGAFHQTVLDLELRLRDVEQLVLCGVATGIAIESAARAAHDLRYELCFATDTMADPDPRRHKASVELNFPLMGQCASSEEIVAALRSADA